MHYGTAHFELYCDVLVFEIQCVVNFVFISAQLQIRLACDMIHIYV